MSQRSTRFMAAFLSVLAFASMASAPADARRGGSFGSRGSRTYSVPRSTYGSGYVPPIERSMTSRPVGQPSPGYASGYAQPSTYRPAGSRFGGFGGGLLTGVIAGGLIGHFFGHGMGGGWGGGGSGGFLAAFIQIAILAGIVWLVIGFFRRRSGTPGMPIDSGYQPRDTYAPQAASGPWGRPAAQPQGMSQYQSQSQSQASGDSVDIAITPQDQQAFERLLVDVQDAFGREDYARLRELTAPGIMSYLSEELSQNATQGVRNEVSATRLLDAEVSEAWSEPSGDYATIVMRYESIDVMRNRTTGLIVSGAGHMPSETVELWTFVRSAGSPWKLSAIQEN